MSLRHRSRRAEAIGGDINDQVAKAERVPRRAQRAVRLDGWYADPRDRADPLFLAGSDGKPGRLPLTAQVWADQLCAVLGPYTEAEIQALPAGVQDRRPCL